MSERTFHLFPQLPTELRLLIWELCLPCRVAEQDPAFGLLDGKDGRQICAPSETTIQNTKLPMIATVCHESLSVVLREGRWLHVQGALSLEKVWVQPRRDTLHLNFTPRSSNNSGRHEEVPSMLLMSLYYAREIKVETSIVAEVIYPFRLCTPMEDTHNRGLRPHWHHYPRPRRVIPDDPYKIVDRLMNLQRPNKEMIELARFCDMFWKGEGIKQSLDVVMAAVSLHIDREITLPSELFGLLGDAPIQMIDCYDSVRLESFEVWSQQCTEIKEPGIHKLFQLFKSPHFQMSVIDWEKKAEWAIIAHMWHFDHVDNSNDGFTGNKDGPGSAWLPYLPPGQIQYLNMVDYSPNENHPWVIKTRKIMPELCPQIMVRLCTNRCDVKKKTERGWRSYGISKRQRRFFQHGSL